MKTIKVFLSEIFQFLEVKFSIYLNRRVFVMDRKTRALTTFLLDTSLMLWEGCLLW